MRMLWLAVAASVFLLVAGCSGHDQPVPSAAAATSAWTPTQAALAHWWLNKMRPDLNDIASVVSGIAANQRSGDVTAMENGCADLITLTQDIPIGATLLPIADNHAQLVLAAAVGDYGAAGQACQEDNPAVAVEMLKQANGALQRFLADLPPGTAR